MHKSIVDCPAARVNNDSTRFYTYYHYSRVSSLCIAASVRLFVRVSVCLCVCVSMCVCPSVCLCVCLSGDKLKNH